MKRAMDIFAEEGLKFFGINKKVKELGTTELIVKPNLFTDKNITTSYNIFFK